MPTRGKLLFGLLPLPECLSAYFASTESRHWELPPVTQFCCGFLPIPPDWGGGCCGAERKFLRKGHFAQGLQYRSQRKSVNLLHHLPDWSLYPRRQLLQDRL